MNLISQPPSGAGEYLGFHQRFGWGIFGYNPDGGWHGPPGLTHWMELPPKPYVEEQAL